MSAKAFIQPQALIDIWAKMQVFPLIFTNSIFSPLKNAFLGGKGFCGVTEYRARFRDENFFG